MWQALPASDYYGNSASMMDIRVHSVFIPFMPSLVHIPGLIHIGEAAGRSLYPCFLQVDADVMVWLRSPHDPLLGALRVRSHFGCLQPPVFFSTPSAFCRLSRVGRGDISALRCG